MVQKCEYCKAKKVSTILAFSCKCGLKLLCENCRHAENHSCKFDYQKEARDRLNKDNPKIIADKVDKIEN